MAFLRTAKTPHSSQNSNDNTNTHSASFTTSMFHKKDEELPDFRAVTITSKQQVVSAQDLMVADSILHAKKEIERVMNHANTGGMSL